MPWYQPGAVNGYSKFYANPELREDRWIVSDAWGAALELSYIQAYVNAGGPDYEDTGSILFDHFAANAITTNQQAAELGRADALRDIQTNQTAHPDTTVQPGGSIPEQGPTGAPPVINTATSGGEGVAFLSLNGLPTSGGSAAPNAMAAGYASAPFRPAATGSGFSLSTIVILAVLGGAAWYLMKGK